MPNLRIKPSIYILKESEDIYEVIFTSTRKVKKFKVDSLVKDCITKLKSQPTLEELTQDLAPAYSRSDVVSCLEALKSEGLVLEWSPEHLDSRYEKQIAFISELSDSMQETLDIQNKLRRSKVAVLGTGGIGTWVVNGLYQIGMGEIRISDPDIVSLSNLNRQLFFQPEDVGQKKVDVLKKRLADAPIVSYDKRVDSSTDLTDILSGTDFIVNCADSPSVVDTGRIIGIYAKKLNIPYMVAGGYNMHLGMVGVIIKPGESACFECLLEYQKKNDPLSRMEIIKDIEATGNLGPIAGVVANLHVMEIFKYIIGKGQTNVNRFYEIDFMDFDVKWKNYEKMPGCKTCNPAE
jgi:molybdopterin/thiamine biosynthesis adenylyltransferase